MLSDILQLLSEASSSGLVMEDVGVDAVEWAAHCRCPLQGRTDGVRWGLFLALLTMLHSKFPPGAGAPEGVRSSMGPGPLAFRAKADFSKLC